VIYNTLIVGKYLNLGVYIIKAGDIMVVRSIEIKGISFDVEKKQQDEMIRKINKLYPDLEVLQKGNNITVKGDLKNYKRRDMIVYILSGGKHGKNVHA